MRETAAAPWACGGGGGAPPGREGFRRGRFFFFLRPGILRDGELGKRKTARLVEQCGRPGLGRPVSPTEGSARGLA